MYFGRHPAVCVEAWHRAALELFYANLSSFPSNCCLAGSLLTTGENLYQQPCRRPHTSQNIFLPPFSLPDLFLTAPLHFNSIATFFLTMCLPLPRFS